MIVIGIRIHKTEHRPTIEKICKARSCVFEKVNKIDNLSERLREKKTTDFQPQE